MMSGLRGLPKCATVGLPTILGTMEQKYTHTAELSWCNAVSISRKLQVTELSSHISSGSAAAEVSQLRSDERPQVEEHKKSSGQGDLLNAHLRLIRQIQDLQLV